MSFDLEHHGSSHRASADATSSGAYCDRDALSVALPWSYHGLGSCDDCQAKGKESRAVVFSRIYSGCRVFLAFILASRPDVALLDRIRRLEEQVASIPANTTRVEPPPI